MRWVMYCMAISLMLQCVYQEAESKDAAKQTLVVQCRARQTGLNGARNACKATPGQIRAPMGYVLAENTLARKVLSHRGTGKGCWYEFSEYVAIVPGIEQPTVLTVKANARSPRRPLSGAGWINCEFTIDMVKLPSPPSK